MRKEQDKMALENIKQDNVAAAAGYMREIKEIEKICGIPFFGYQITLEVEKESEGKDKIIVVLPRYAAGLIGEPTIESIKWHCEGKKALVMGTVQTLRDHDTGETLVFILASFSKIVEHPLLQNDVLIRGIIARKPRYKKTPKGKRITELYILSGSQLTKSMCQIPCICRGQQAEDAKKYKKWDVVELTGRYLGREYTKVIDAATGKTEKRTVREISVREIRKAENDRE